MPSTAKRLLTKSNFEILGTLLLILIFTFVVSKIAGERVKVEDVKRLVESFGVLAPLIFIILAAITNVIPPMAVLPFWVAGIAVFGFPYSYIYIYISNVLGSIGGYLIGRKWGRGAVIKLGGEKTLREVERFTGFKEILPVFLLRLLGGVATDYISYAFGIGKVNFGVYVISTTLGLIPTMLVGIWFINKALVSDPLTAAGLLGSTTIINYIISLIFIPLIFILFKPSNNSNIS